MPKQDERTRWNARYSAGSHTGLAPDHLLVTAYDEFLRSERPGHALDLAGGAGRHSLWLAERGWSVKLVDVSDVAVRLADGRARGLSGGMITTENLDLSRLPDLGQDQFDLILVFYFLERKLFPALIRALKSRGFLIYRTYTVEQRRLVGGPSNPRYLLQPNELRQAFQDLEILRYGESITDQATAELVARKGGTILSS
ncbi:MAG TPA: methyltransferase domain-containing protein [Terriglobales bacterium]